MKTKSIFSGIVLFATISAGFVACNEPILESDGVLTEKSAVLNTPVTYPDLVTGEETGILLMREEEKMAGDVYASFYTQWDLSLFQNIAASEDNHYDAINTLIQAYGLKDPSTGVAGTFTNAAIAELYGKLVKAGSASVQEALKTGAFIEEYDILDLEKLIAATENPAIKQIYGNLLRGSRNHLRSFVTTLANYQMVYTPQLMDAEVFKTIISSPMETGNQNGMNNGNGQGNGKGNGQGNGKGKGNGNSGNGNGASNGTGNGTGTCTNG